ncbi:hypothetical protein JW859_13265 [bacterium]|nr:hypothetical protein [bacterium]
MDASYDSMQNLSDELLVLNKDLKAINGDSYATSELRQAPGFVSDDYVLFLFAVLGSFVGSALDEIIMSQTKKAVTLATTRLKQFCEIIRRRKSDGVDTYIPLEIQTKVHFRTEEDDLTVIYIEFYSIKFG